MKALLIFIIPLLSFADCPPPIALPGIGEITKLAPKDCKEMTIYFLGLPEEKEDLCNCVQSNIDKFSLENDRSNTSKALKLVDFATIPIVQFTEDIMTAEKVIPEYNIGSCNIESKLTDTNSAIFNCGGEDTALSKKERVEKAKEIYNKIKAEIKLKSDPDSSNPGFYQRGENQCQISDEIVIEAKLSAIKSAIHDQKKILMSSDAQDNYKTLQDLINKKDEFDEISGLSNKYSGNSYFDFLKGSKDFLGSLPNYEDKVKDAYFKNIRAKCDSVFTNLKKALCVSSDAKFIPGNFENNLITFQNLEYPEADKYMHYQACSKKESSFDHMKKLIAPTIPSSKEIFTELSEFSGSNLKEIYLPTQNLICDAVKNDLNSEIQKACAPKENEATSYKCKILTAYRKKLNAQKEHLAQEKAYKQLKLEGVTEDLENQVKVRASKLVNNITDKEVEGSLVKEKKKTNLVDSFLGKKESNPLEVARAQNSNANTTTKQRNLSKANKLRQANAKRALAERSPVESADEIYDREMEQFYDEVARRMTSVREKAASLPPSSSQRKQIENSIANSYSLNPGKDTSIGSNFSAPSTASFSSSSAGRNNSRSTSSSSPRSSSTLQRSEPVESYEEKIAREQNDALNEINEKKAQARQAAGKIPDSPFKELSSRNAIGRRPAAANMNSAYDEQVLPVNADTIVEDLDSLIDNVLMEKEQGKVGRNTRHANLILAMLDEKNSKAVTIKSQDNPKFAVQILKTKKGLKLVAIGNTADSGYKKFFNSINDFVIKYGSRTYQDDFRSLLAKLKTAVDKGIEVITTESGTVRYNDFH